MLSEHQKQIYKEKIKKEREQWKQLLTELKGGSGDARQTKQERTAQMFAAIV